jgi:hypothetical protein
VFNTPDGAKVLNFLANKFWVTRPSHHPDPCVQAFREGQRSVIILILTYLGRDFVSQVRKIQEELSDEQAD